MDALFEGQSKRKSATRPLDLAVLKSTRWPTNGRPLLPNSSRLDVNQSSNLSRGAKRFKHFQPLFSPVRRLISTSVGTFVGMLFHNRAQYVARRGPGTRQHCDHKQLACCPIVQPPTRCFLARDTRDSRGTSVNATLRLSRVGFLFSGQSGHTNTNQ
jgi:hypothetical protein